MPTAVGTADARPHPRAGPQADEDYTGYEKDEETQLLYAGARYYMPAVGRFGTTDRFADKYPALSPYNYAANDPANLIDVNGDSLWVQDGDDRILYTAGMEYDGENEFTEKTINTLNAISDLDSGEEVLQRLTSSETNYTLTADMASGGEGTASTVFDNDGSGEVRLGGAMGESAATRANMVGHELFTLFQKDHGQDPYTVFSEVGAYLFGGSVKLEGFGKPPIYNAGTTYGSAMTNLMGEFSSQDYHDAARTFKEANAPGCVPVFLDQLGD